MVSAKFPVKHIPTAPTPRTAALPVRQPGERAQPGGHRAGLAGGEGAELGADARLAEDRRPLVGARHRAVAAEQRRHVDRESRVAHPAGEAGHLRADAGHLGHDDYGRAGAGHVHPLRDAVERDRARGEVFELVVLVHVPATVAYTTQ
jgi:hypothetical protein